jgi:argininosuccinate lyase
MTKLWQKNQTKVHPLIEKYTVGEDYLLDLKLLPFDILASKAHAEGLYKIGILTFKELQSLEEALDELNDLSKQNKTSIQPEDEDCHTVIENFLVEQLGDLGKKIHTGRSRNDQVLVAIRLFVNSNSQHIEDLLSTLAKQLWHFADIYQNVPMPGYTHTQQAMLTSVGHYFASFAEAFEDDLSFLKLCLKHIHQSPLGSAAGFGVSFKLSRDFVSEKLGFEKVQKNSLYCQASRGKFESIFLEALSQIMLTAGKIANDFLLFTSREFQFFEVDKNLVTGSSIMPQKKNLDLLEILRANVSVVLTNQNQVKQLSKNLFSGYNRDLQLIKKPLFNSLEIVEDSLSVLQVFLEGVKPNKSNILKAIKPDIFAADIANQLVKNQGFNFRDAYQKALEHVGEHVTLEMCLENLKSKKSLGSPGNYLSDKE